MKKILLGTTIILSLGAAGYYLQHRPADASSAIEEEAKPAAPQAMPVQVDVISKQSVQIWNNYSANIEAVEFAEIRPQVSGTITEVKFEDGQFVQKDDILFVIDPRPYQAAVNQAQAELKSAKNQSNFAWKELKRAKSLVKTDTVSKRLYDERQNASSIASSSVEGAKARLERAQIDLDYAHVKAPITGRVSRVEIKQGNLVASGASAPILTTIISTEHVYADFDVDEQTYLKYIRSAARDRDAESHIPVILKLSNDEVEYNGFIHSFDNQINSSTGTIRARALFDNKDGALLPGMFSSVKMGSPAKQETMLVSERAIGTDQNRKFVYIVNAENIVEYREIKIGESTNGKRIVKSGLNEGDKVITEGIIRIRPGMPVTPQI